MKKRSNMFVPGERVTGTMLTIVDSVRPDSWIDVICDCDCGNRVVLPYQRVYYKQFSCGCKRKLRVDAVCYEGYEVTNSAGNHEKGRTLTIISRDTETQQWQYVCACCGEIFLVPRGNERGLHNSLNKLAGQDCPNWLPYTIADRTDALAFRYLPDYRVPFNGTTGYLRLNMAENLAPFYDRKNVTRDKKGRVTGLYGLPSKPLPDAWLKKRYAPTQEPVAMDPDGFESMFDGDSGSGVESTGAR